LSRLARARALLLILFLHISLLINSIRAWISRCLDFEQGKLVDFMFASNLPREIEGRLLKKSQFLGQWRARDVAVQASSRATPAVISWQGGGRVGAIILTEGCARLEGDILHISSPERTVQFRAEAGAPVPITRWHAALVSASPDSARQSGKTPARATLPAAAGGDAAVTAAEDGVAAMSRAPAQGVAPPVAVERAVRAVLRPADGGPGAPVVQFRLNFTL
jgi:hypothetical protein